MDTEIQSLRDRVTAALATHPNAMTLQLARDLGVPEANVLRALPAGRVVELEVGRWEDLIRTFETFGTVHVIVSNAAVTLEATGQFGNFSTFGEFFNVHTDTLDMHVRWSQLGAVFAVEKPGHKDGHPTHSVQFFDWAGAATFFAGLLALLLGLNQGHAWGWTSPATLGLIGASVVLLAVFLRIERRVPRPMLDLALFARPAFAGATASAVINYVCVYGILFLVPFYVVLCVAFGTFDPIFRQPVPIWNPLQWYPGTFRLVFHQLFGAHACRPARRQIERGGEQDEGGGAVRTRCRPRGCREAAE